MITKIATIMSNLFHGSECWQFGKWDMAMVDAFRPRFVLLRHSRRKSIPSRRDYQTLSTLFHIGLRCRCCIWQVPLLLVPYVVLVGQLLLGRGESLRSIVQLSVVVFFLFFLADLSLSTEDIGSSSAVLGNQGDGQQVWYFVHLYISWKLPAKSVLKCRWLLQVTNGTLSGSK